MNRAWIRSAILPALCISSAAFAGCRGEPSEDPPIHLVSDMDWQSKRTAQQESPKDEDGKFIFADKRSSRPLVAGTVPYGKLKEDDAFFRGVDDAGKNVRRMPIAAVLEATHKKSLDEVAQRGEDRFHVFCTPCHDASGGGNGMVIQRAVGAFPPPTLLSSAVVKEMPDGQLFNTISHGARNMPGYAAQIPEADRWAIVLWVRVLSRSQAAKIDDVPAASRSSILAEDAVAPQPAVAPKKEGSK